MTDFPVERHSEAMQLGCSNLCFMPIADLSRTIRQADIPMIKRAIFQMPPVVSTLSTGEPRLGSASISLAWTVLLQAFGEL